MFNLLFLLFLVMFIFCQIFEIFIPRYGQTKEDKLVFLPITILAWIPVVYGIWPWALSNQSRQLSLCRRRGLWWETSTTRVKSCITLKLWTTQVTQWFLFKLECFDLP